MKNAGKVKGAVRRSRSGINETRLARAAGVSAGHLHRVLSGERKPGDALRRFLRRSGVAV